MAEKIQKKFRKLGNRGLPFSKNNYLLFGIALAILAVGYWALAQPPVDGFLTLTVAPILLVISYCVLIPVAIIWSHKSKPKE
jgi:uncharacterized RDD family membrane protein YckC